MTTILDEADRPEAPALPDVTATQRRHGKRLAMFHRYHLMELERTRAAMVAVNSGAAEPGSLAPAIAAMRIVENTRRFGNLCGQECQLLSVHHTIEDEAIFPTLRQAAPAFRIVLDRLAAEHEVIHALIDELAADAATVTADPTPDSFAACKTTFERLERFVRSHFGYEERQIEDALGVYSVDI